MGYRAVALSQVGGAGGEHIGHELARKLGFAYLNEAIVAQVAEGSGVDTASVTEAERRKSFFTRVSEAASRASLDYVARRLGALPLRRDGQVPRADQRHRARRCR